MPLVESHHFSQIPLHRMTRGLAKPIARIRLEPKDIATRFGITFEPSRDDLDQLEAAVFRSKSGRQFALVRHQHQPDPGTDILTNENSRRLTEDLREVLRFLALRWRDLSWIHPGIKASSISRQVETFQKHLSAIFNSNKRKRFEVARAKMGAAAKARWAKRTSKAKRRVRARGSSTAVRRKASRISNVRRAARARPATKNK